MLKLLIYFIDMDVIIKIFIEKKIKYKNEK